MSDIAIRVENLSKLYKIGKREKYQTLRDSLTELFTRPFRRRAKGGLGEDNNGEDQFWALKDVSLEIQHGEVVGIIGRNGAGKTTLLKILSRITEPTTGQAKIYGRVGSLLEVGTGFHPELTGRENIYLNAAILGMKKVDINRKFDEIVAFAEVEKFLDTPVKHYSSGMYVRLAFAVAAHLEPEILLVDEVLAVGDIAFQKKCLGKMDEISKGGTTVLFVSHNMATINSLTDKCLLLKDGIINSFGETSAITNKYISESSNILSIIEWKDDKLGDDNIAILSCIIGDGNIYNFFSDSDINIEFIYIIKKELIGIRVGFDLVSAEGIVIFRAYHDDNISDISSLLPGKYKSTCLIPRNLLNQGIYYVTLRVGIHGVKRICLLENILSFSVVNISGINSRYGGNRVGIINPNLSWRNDKLIN